MADSGDLQGSASEASGGRRASGHRCWKLQGGQDVCDHLAKPEQEGGERARVRDRVPQRRFAKEGPRGIPRPLRWLDPEAVDTLTDEWVRVISLLRHPDPAGHRTTNGVESPVAAVLLRPNAAKGIRRVAARWVRDRRPARCSLPPPDASRGGRLVPCAGNGRDAGGLERAALPRGGLLGGGRGLPYNVGEEAPPGGRAGAEKWRKRAPHREPRDRKLAAGMMLQQGRLHERGGAGDSVGSRHHDGRPPWRRCTRDSAWRRRETCSSLRGVRETLEAKGALRHPSTPTGAPSRGRNDGGVPPGRSLGGYGANGVARGADGGNGGGGVTRFATPAARPPPSSPPPFGATPSGFGTGARELDTPCVSDSPVARRPEIEYP